ncbi:MAG: VCBS repeat-containing protein [Nostoc sp. TH1S01]|nr:VCBS repeat-containing protein [Nostoc sp. TH1S01]
MTTSVTFAPVRHYSVSSFSANPQTSVVGDFNKDGYLDLAYIYTTEIDDSDSGGILDPEIVDDALPTVVDGPVPTVNELLVRFGNSSGGFGSAKSYSVGESISASNSATNYVSYSPNNVAVGDFNSDGYLDLVTVNKSNISVLLNNQSAGFSSAITFNVQTNSVKVGDFDADGYDDILIDDSQKAAILFNNQSAIFGSSINPTLVDKDSASGYFDGDGSLDVAKPADDGNFIQVTFSGSSSTEPVPYTVGTRPTEVAVGDFNSDGILDLVSANSNSTKVSVLLGDGSGDFGTAFDFNLGSSSSGSFGQLTVGDFNGDGKDDISRENADGTISVLLNNTLGYLTHSNNDDIFQLGGSEFTKVKIKIQIKGRSSTLLNELGVFNVDDNEGKIDGVAPGEAGYQEKALARAKTIFSVLNNNPAGFAPDDLSRILEYDGGTQLRFYLKSQGNIIFSDSTTQEISSLSEGSFSIGWKDGSRSNSLFDDLQISIQETDEDLPIGIGLQGKSEGEAIDLRNFSSDSLIAGTFSVYREASYNNYVGFYKVVDESGGIDTNGDGTADVLVGDAGYLQAAINQRVTGIGLSVGNQGTSTSQANLTGGGIYVPFLVVNGGIDALLDSNTSNDPTVFFTFLGANSDKSQHVRLLGDNTFGFEDLVGGDNDFNDVIVKIGLTVTAQNTPA